MIVVWELPLTYDILWYPWSASLVELVAPLEKMSKAHEKFTRWAQFVGQFVVLSTCGKGDDNIYHYDDHWTQPSWKSYLFVNVIIATNSVQS